VNSAPPAVLASVPGMTVEFANRLITARLQRPLDEETLRRITPPSAAIASTYLRAKPSNIIRFFLTMRSDGVRTFAGHAVLSDRGIRAVTLTPFYEFSERKP